MKIELWNAEKFPKIKRSVAEKRVGCGEKRESEVKLNYLKGRLLIS